MLNPNAILFGSTAQLDIRGSFLATTADSILFDNGLFEFRAIASPLTPPLLRVHVPIGLQHGSFPSQEIRVEGDLRVDDGQSVELRPVGRG